MKRTIATLFFLLATFSVAAFSQDTGFNRKYMDIDKSHQGLGQYKTSIVSTHAQLADAGLESVHSTITFQEPLGLSDIDNLLIQHDINPVLTYAFAESSDGEIVTIAGKFKDGVVQGITEITDDSPDLKLLGVVAIVGTVRAANVERLQADERVFLVDISADRNLTHNPRNRGYMQHFGWDLYQLRESERDSIQLK